MKTKMILILLVLLGIMACDKDKDDKDHKLMILGKWEQVEPYCCDTFDFKTDGTLIIQYGETYTYSYEILSRDSIRIENINGMKNYSYEFNSSFSSLKLKKYHPFEDIPTNTDLVDALLKKLN